MSASKPAVRQPEPPDTASTQVNEARPQTWADPGTWSASVKFLPAYLALVAVFIAVYWNNFNETRVDMTDYNTCREGFNYTFHINKASSEAQDLSKSAKEIAWAFEATQEIYDPHRSVFGGNPFPKGKVPTLGLRLDEASVYFDTRTKFVGSSLLNEGNVKDSSTAALGIPAIMYGQKWSGRKFMTAATKLKDIIFKLPLFGKDAAISHRLEEPELWAEASGYFAPFLAYLGVANDDLVLVTEAVRQVQAYRDNLAITTGTTKGLWQHVVSQSSGSDTGAWSTGNGVAAYGMAKLRAIISGWPKSNAVITKELDNLDFWIQEILDAAIETDDDASGLLRNYLGDSSWEGETSGTSLLAATVYRMTRIRPDVFAQAKYLDWAERKRRAVFDQVDNTGTLGSAVDPNNSKSKVLVEGSAEGESFLILLATAWRDVVCTGASPSVVERYFEETLTRPVELNAPLTFETITGYSFSEIMKAYRDHLRRFYEALWKSIKTTFERSTGLSVDALYTQAMEPLQRYGKYLSGPS